MPKKKLNMTIGRFQPFTQGHLNMVNEGDAPCIIYRMNSSNKAIEKKFNRKDKSLLDAIKIGSKKWTKQEVRNVIDCLNNGGKGKLSENEKELIKRPFTNELIDEEMEIIKKNNKNVLDIVIVKTMFDALDQFNAFCEQHQDEWEPQYWMCGNDRVDDYNKNLDKYIYNADELETAQNSGTKVKNVLKGVLKTNIGKGRTKGISGTDVRASIITKDINKFKQIMPKGTDVMFDKFGKAFDEFKSQIENIIKEFKMITLKDFINERLQLNPDSRIRSKNKKVNKPKEDNEVDIKK